MSTTTDQSSEEIQKLKDEARKKERRSANATVMVIAVILSLAFGSALLYLSLGGYFNTIAFPPTVAPTMYAPNWPTKAPTSSTFATLDNPPASEDERTVIETESEMIVIQDVVTNVNVARNSNTNTGIRGTTKSDTQQPPVVTSAKYQDQDEDEDEDDVERFIVEKKEAKNKHTRSAKSNHDANGDKSSSKHEKKTKDAEQKEIRQKEHDEKRATKRSHHGH